MKVKSSELEGPCSILRNTLAPLRRRSTSGTALVHIGEAESATPDAGARVPGRGPGGSWYRSSLRGPTRRQFWSMFSQRLRLSGCRGVSHFRTNVPIVPTCVLTSGAEGER